MFSIADTKTHATTLVVDGGVHDIPNRETSGIAMMNSVRPALHSDFQKFITGTFLGPVVFVLITPHVCGVLPLIPLKLCTSGQSLVRTSIHSLKRARGTTAVSKDSLTRSPGTAALEGANEHPEDVAVILMEALMDCTAELFKLQFLTLFNQCDSDPLSSTDIITAATSTYYRLQGRNTWNVDTPHGGAISMAGALVPRDTQGSHGLCAAAAEVPNMSEAHAQTAPKVAEADETEPVAAEVTHHGSPRLQKHDANNIPLAEDAG